MAHFYKQLVYLSAETINKGFLQWMAWMEMDHNLKNLAKLFKTFLCVQQKSISMVVVCIFFANYGKFFVKTFKDDSNSLNR